MQFFFQLVSNEVSGRLQHVTSPVYNLSRNFFGLVTIGQSKLVLHGAIFFNRFSQRWKKKPTTSRRSHVPRCSLELQLAMVSKQSMQSLQKIEPSSTLCSCCKPKKVARHVAKKARYTLQPTCNLSRNAVATSVP